MKQIGSRSYLRLFVPALLFLAVACAPAGSDNPARSAVAGLHTPPDGQAVFRLYCVTCHGADGRLGMNGAKDLSKSALALEERVALITKGKGLMTPFGELLAPEEIRAVAEYSLTFK